MSSDKLKKDFKLSTKRIKKSEISKTMTEFCFSILHGPNIEKDDLYFVS
jgi:hypothetical protein